MDNLDYIESYFSNSPGLAETKEFEKKIETDPVFAEEVAFYLSVLNISREESREQKKIYFKELYKNNRAVVSIPVRKLVYYVAAAAVVVGLIFGVYTFIKPVSPRQLANQYIQEHLQTLSVTMGGKIDPLQTGLGLYNEGKSAEALKEFEKIIQSNASDFTAKKYAGLAALRLKEYDKAIKWFESMEAHTGLYTNPAPFYLALTLMERNQSGDEIRAKQILQQIVQSDGEKKEDAQELLKKM